MLARAFGLRNVLLRKQTFKKYVGPQMEGLVDCPTRERDETTSKHVHYSRRPASQIGIKARNLAQNKRR